MIHNLSKLDSFISQNSADASNLDGPSAREIRMFRMLRATGLRHRSPFSISVIIQNASSSERKPGANRDNPAQNRRRDTAS